MSGEPSRSALALRTEGEIIKFIYWPEAPWWLSLPEIDYNG